MEEFERADRCILVIASQLAFDEYCERALERMDNVSPKARIKGRTRGKGMIVQGENQLLSFIQVPTYADPEDLQGYDRKTTGFVIVGETSRDMRGFLIEHFKQNLNGGW